MTSTIRWQTKPPRPAPRDLRREELEQVYVALRRDLAEKSVCIIQQARYIGILEMEREHWRVNALASHLVAVAGWVMFAGMVWRAWL